MMKYQLPLPRGSIKLVVINLTYTCMRGFADIFRVCSLRTIKNHLKTFLLINLQKTKTCPKLNIAARAIGFNTKILAN